MHDPKNLYRPNSVASPLGVRTWGRRLKED
jgi:hypothetical protein